MVRIPTHRTPTHLVSRSVTLSGACPAKPAPAKADLRLICVAAMDEMIGLICGSVGRSVNVITSAPLACESELTLDCVSACMVLREIQCGLNERLHCLPISDA